MVDQNRRTVATARAASDGRTSLHLGIGTYTVRPQPVPGLMGTPTEFALVVDHSTTPLTITYDTGIR